MSIASTLQGLFGGTKARTHGATETGSKYGVMERGKNYIKVRAPSGADALRIAGADGNTPAGTRFSCANHQGGGIYYVETEPWPSDGNHKWQDAPSKQKRGRMSAAEHDRMMDEIKRGENPYRR